MLEVSIGKLGAQGDGIAETTQGPVYVAGGVPGDRLRISLKGERGSIEEVLEPSAARQDPPCRHFGECGGCALQHVEDSAYRAWKSGLIQESLSRRGIEDVEIEAIAASPPGSRRRARFAALRRRDGSMVLGFNARRSKHIVNLAACEILRPSIVARLDDIRALLALLLKPGAGCDVQVTEADSGLDIWLLGNREPKAAAIAALAAKAEAMDLARLSIGPDADPLAARRPVTVELSGTTVEIPPGAFMQATAEGENALCGIVSATIEQSGARRTADLYCGIGTFTFAMAKQATVLAVEGDAGTLDALIAGRNRAQGLRAIEAEVRDLTKRPLMAAECKKIDAVVFDPPRTGAQAQAAALAHSAVPLVIAVSCNPATFARDARLLIDGGYRLERIWPIDQFLWSPHLELVAQFTR